MGLLSHALLLDLGIKRKHHRTSGAPGGYGHAWGRSRASSCTNDRLGNVEAYNVPESVPACTNLLQTRAPWQCVSATEGPMLLGAAQGSKGEEQETRMRETALPLRSSARCCRWPVGVDAVDDVCYTSRHHVSEAQGRGHPPVATPGAPLPFVPRCVHAQDA